MWEVQHNQLKSALFLWMQIEILSQATGPQCVSIFQTIWTACCTKLGAPVAEGLYYRWKHNNRLEQWSAADTSFRATWLMRCLKSAVSGFRWRRVSKSLKTAVVLVFQRSELHAPCQRSANLVASESCGIRCEGEETVKPFWCAVAVASLWACGVFQLSADVGSQGI